MNKKLITTGVAIAAALAVTLSGCGSGSSNGDGNAKSQGPIKVWLSNNEQEIGWEKR